MSDSAIPWTVVCQASLSSLSSGVYSNSCPSEGVTYDRLVYLLMSFYRKQIYWKAVWNVLRYQIVQSLSWYFLVNIGLADQKMWFSLCLALSDNSALGWEAPLEKEQQPTPIFLPGKFHGRWSLVGYSPWGHKELNMTEQLILSL